MTKRRFWYATAKRPDELVAIWVTADKKFSESEAFAKIANITEDMIDSCDFIAASYNQQLEAEVQEEKDTITLKSARVIEVVSPPKCSIDILKTIKKDWGGKWTKTKAGYKKNGKS